MTRTSSTVVPVLGMHRSGTSMLARMLNLMGVQLGEPLLEANHANVHGFWENRFFLGVDMRALQVMGCHPHGFAPEERLLAAAQSAASLSMPPGVSGPVASYLREQFGDAGLWGWKDPRTVLLYPFWERLLRELGYQDLRPVIILRSPAASVSSMCVTGFVTPVAEQAGLSVNELSLQIWRAYNRILRDIQDRTNAYISVYDWFLSPQSAVQELGRLAGYLDLETADLRPALASIKSAGIRPAEAKNMDASAQQLYQELVSVAEHQRARS
ncbi:MAG: hypothetical protein KDG50_15610 [Chromatiales bacterium]|nr:hypothetical protein [Chromatiales bacterium]